jgi:hypothetical protein
MTATLIEARQALAAVLAGLAGFRETYPHFQLSVNPPCAIVEYPEGEFLNFEVTLDDERTVQLAITLLVPRGQDRSASELLDGWLEKDGPASIFAAVEADPTLGGVVSSAAVTTAGSYGTVQWSDTVSYLGCSVHVEVFL